jgi:formate--tetrahydrofolate ligase
MPSTPKSSHGGKSLPGATIRWARRTGGDRVPTDLEIAQRATLLPIGQVAARLGIPEDAIEPYGRTKAKLSLDWLARQQRPPGKLVLVSAISPTTAGEGKTTTTVGLGDALNRIGKRAVICLREPSLGPVFGMKGGAAGGGYAQVVPMEDINLHFTGDFHAIAAAHNLLAAMVDNHIHHGNALGIDLRRVSWKRVVDLNDRALRDITVGLGGPGNGYPRQDGFDIVAASEVMAIFCLATSLHDLKLRLGEIVVGYTRERKPVRARDLRAQGAMAALLHDAIKPNLVQTLENNPALIHGGPFGNIAHGCNSVIATRAGLELGDYVVTEAGFGADLGAEKFIDIKCRLSGLRPDLVVLVATMRALKFHGGLAADELAHENLVALEKGIANLERHLHNVRMNFGLPCVVAINRFESDTAAEIELLRRRIAHHGAPVLLADHWARGGAGAEDLARAVVDAVNGGPPPALRFAYDDSDKLWDKAVKVATRIYGASEVTADSKVRARIRELQAEGYGGCPVCIAKTQYSFSTDPLLRGAPSGHVLNIREVRLAAGAGFVVMVCGDVMTMPGLPKEPAATSIDVTDAGSVVGLF